MKSVSACLLFLLLHACTCNTKDVSEKDKFEKDIYNLKDYKELERGMVIVDDVLMPNVILMQHKTDTSHTAKLTYTDSLYNDLATIFFYFKGVADGPFKSYSDGKLFVTGYYKNGKREGERIVHGQRFIRSRQFFKNGKKIGTWEEYDGNGKLKRKTSYDDNGNLIDDILY